MGAVCPHCRASDIEYDSAAGNSVCINCGAVVEENAVVAEVTFAELSNGASVLEGQFISAERGKTSLPTIFGRRVGDLGGGKTSDGTSLESREMTLANGRRRIQALAGAVGLTGEHYMDAAGRWYSLALQHQFTRGRRGPNVIAACLYIVCRQERTPHMLLDFADVLATSVYSLGGTFLRLVRLLNLEMPLVDPSFFVARFAARLDFGDKTSQVANTALRVVARMKRDWIQTGRRPAGVCAAGLIIAARMHGFRRTEAEVVRVVRICEATLKKRLEEFGRTASSQLTPQEFEGIWLEQEADPPSFSHTRSKPADVETIHVLPTLYYQRINASSTEDFPFTPADSQASLAASEHEADSGASLSDVDVDDEMASILLDEVEVALKTRYWTEMNQDYLDKEAEKARLQALDADHLRKLAELAEGQSMKRITPHREKEGYEDHPVAPDVSSLGLTPSLKTPTCRKRIRTRSTAPKQDQLPPASSAAEATKQVLQSKRLSKKINYQALEELFTSTAAAISR